jgi:hypothetical protein
VPKRLRPLPDAQANLLPPVLLVALNLLLGHSQELAELRLREAARYAHLGEEFSQPQVVEAYLRKYHTLRSALGAGRPGPHSYPYPPQYLKPWP